MTTRNPRWGGVSKGQGPKAHLRVLATTDLHAQLVPWDFFADRPMPGRGLSCLAGLVDQARAEVPGALLFDNGDFLTGSPLADELTCPGASDGPHPVIQAMNLLGYDAVGLGNHEFSRGLDYLRQSLALAQFPVLAANVRCSEGRFAYLPHLVLDRWVTDGAGDRHPLRIGVTAALPPQTMLWEKHHLAGQLEMGDILAAIRVQLRALRQAGADVVVVLAHSGLAAEGSRSARMRTNVAGAVAALPGVDVVVAGHTHDAMPLQPVAGAGGAALILPGAMASHLGVVDLHLVRLRDRWRLTGYRAELRAPGPEAPENLRMAELAAPALIRIRKRLDAVVGQSSRQLDTHFALIGRSSALRFVGRAICDHLTTALQPALPVLAAVAATRTGGRGGPSNYVLIPPGPLRERDLGSILPFDDRLAATEIDGAGLVRWLEHSASIFRQIAPGAQNATLLNPEVPGFLFDMIVGLTYRVDLSVPAGQGRICDLACSGRAVRPGDRFILATSSHRLGGGGGFPLPAPRCEIALPPASLRDILRRAVRSSLGVEGDGEPVWSFVPMPGSSAIFDSAPEAVAHARDLIALGEAPGGFQRFRLHL